MNIKTMFTVIMILTMFSGVKAETVENLERMRALIGSLSNYYGEITLGFYL